MEEVKTVLIWINVVGTKPEFQWCVNTVCWPYELIRNWNDVTGSVSLLIFRIGV